MVIEMKHWIGDAPEKCEICSERLVSIFVDGSTVYGPWSVMCIRCHYLIGIGLGPGKGQKYRKHNGEWILTNW